MWVANNTSLPSTVVDDTSDKKRKEAIIAHEINAEQKKMNHSLNSEEFD